MATNKIIQLPAKRTFLYFISRIIFMSAFVLGVYGKNTPILGTLEPIEPKMIHADICGFYALYGERTADLFLHIYPGGDAMIVHADDLSPGVEELIVSGHWLLENDVLQFHWMNWQTSKDVDRQRVLTFATKYRLFRRSSCNGRFEYYLLHENEKPDVHGLYTWRISQYIDWPRTKLLLSKAGANRADR